MRINRLAANAARVCSILFVAHPTLVLADEVAETELNNIADPADIETITVIGERAYSGVELGGRPITKLPVASHVATREELERLKFVDPDEFLDRIPGESQVRNLRIPQGGKSYTVPLVDGMPLASPYSGATQDITTINSLDIERIEVIKGPASALYANNAFGGVINVVTRRAPEEFEGRAWAEIGEFNRRRFGISAAGSSGMFGFFFDANTQNTDGLRETYQNDRDQISAKVSFEPNEKLRAFVRYEHMDRHEIFPGDLRDSEFDTDPTVVGRTAGSTDQTGSDSVIAKFIHQVGTGAVEFGFVHRVEDIIGDGRFTPPRDTSDKSTHFKLQFDQELGNVHIVLGAESFDGDVHTNDYEASDVTLSGPIEVTSDSDLQIKSLFGQVSYSATERLTLVAGLRHEDIEMATFFELDSAEPLNHGNRFERSFNNSAPKLGIMYQLTDTVGLWGNLSWGYLPPDIGDLFLDRPEANPDLKEEKARHIEFGVRGQLGKLLYNSSYYNTRISNFLVTEDDGLIETTTNAGQVTSQGIETVLEYSFSDQIRLGVTHTYSRNIFDTYFGADDDGDNDLSGNHLSRSPDHHLNARLAFLPLEGLTIEAEGDFYTGYYTRDDNSIDPEGKFARGERLNLRLNYEIGRWAIWLHGLNLTDTLEDRVSYTPPSSRGAGRRNIRIVDGRTIYGGISYKF